MPIEIRELVIKVAVDQNDRRPAGGIDARELAVLKNKIVKECLESIRMKLDKISER